ncbi:MAG: hypothetical protein ACI8QZ_003717, partial [Chlamydiales bacterium]
FALSAAAASCSSSRAATKMASSRYGTFSTGC